MLVATEKPQKLIQCTKMYSNTSFESVRTGCSDDRSEGARAMQLWSAVLKDEKTKDDKKIKKLQDSLKNPDGNRGLMSFPVMTFIIIAMRANKTKKLTASKVKNSNTSPYVDNIKDSLRIEYAGQKKS